MEAIFLTCVLRPLLFLSFFTSICLVWGCCKSKLCHALRDIGREVANSRGTGDNNVMYEYCMCDKQSCCENNGHPTSQRTKKMDSVNRHTARERPVSSKERTKSSWNQKSITICDKHSRSFYSTSPFRSLQSDKLAILAWNSSDCFESEGVITTRSNRMKFRLLAIYARQVLLNHKTSL